MQGCDGGKDAYSDKPQVGRARGIVTRRGGEGEETGEGGNQGYSDGERGERGIVKRGGEVAVRNMIKGEGVCPIFTRALDTTHS